MYDLEEGYGDILKYDPFDSTINALYEKLFTCILIHAEAIFIQVKGFKYAKVKEPFKDSHGKNIGNFDKNLIPNSIINYVDFPGVAVNQYAANTIAQNMY